MNPSTTTLNSIRSPDPLDFCNPPKLRHPYQTDTMALAFVLALIIAGTNLKDQSSGQAVIKNSVIESYSLTDFDYQLPTELIAQQPSTDRTGSRLLHVNTLGQMRDMVFSDLPTLLRPHDLLVFNDTKVIKARLYGVKESGGRIEVLVERLLDARHVLAHVRSSKSPKPNSRLSFADGQVFATVLGRDNDLFHLAFDHEVLNVLEQHGRVPLPPYIEHADDQNDVARYQTIYASNPGAVAAPTAGLHFDESMFARLGSLGINHSFVTLHVGAGTFQPVRDNDLSRHMMHTEWYCVPDTTAQAVRRAKANGGRIIAVGTTSVRALESACSFNQGQLRAHQGDTRLFIKPGYAWQIVDAMVTNFHLPQSTLLMLVAAFIGYDTMRAAYAHAIEQRYRFFSYGDAMFLENKDQAHAI